MVALCPLTLSFAVHLSLALFLPTSFRCRFSLGSGTSSVLFAVHAFIPLLLHFLRASVREREGSRKIMKVC